MFSRLPRKMNSPHKPCCAPNQCCCRVGSRHLIRVDRRVELSSTSSVLTSLRILAGFIVVFSIVCLERCCVSRPAREELLSTTWQVFRSDVCQPGLFLSELSTLRLLASSRSLAPRSVSLPRAVSISPITCPVCGRVEFDHGQQRCKTELREPRPTVVILWVSARLSCLIFLSLSKEVGWDAATIWYNSDCTASKIMNAMTSTNVPCSIASCSNGSQLSGIQLLSWLFVEALNC